MGKKNPLQLHVLKRKIEIYIYCLFGTEVFPSWSKIYDHNHFNNFLMPNEVPNKNFQTKCSIISILICTKTNITCSFPKNCKCIYHSCLQKNKIPPFYLPSFNWWESRSPILHAHSFGLLKKRGLNKLKL